MPGGRPRKPDAQKRSKLYPLRLTQDEALELERLRREAGCPSLAVYLRKMALQRTPMRPTSSDPNAVEAANRLALELARIGNNINQLARLANRRGEAQGWQGVSELVAGLRGRVDDALAALLEGEPEP